MTDVQFRSDVTVELLGHYGSEQTIVREARVSTQGNEAEEAEVQGLVRFLVREGHTVPLEHTAVTLHIEAPIFVTRQLLKHRIGSISEESGRYRELEPVFYQPNPERKVKQIGKTGAYEFVEDAVANEEAYYSIRYASVGAWNSYEHMLNEGIAREVARMVLPVNLYSTIHLTMNLHSLMNLVRLRTANWGSHPQYEIALVGDKILEIIRGLYPTAMEAFEKKLAPVELTEDDVETAVVEALEFGYRLEQWQIKALTNMLNEKISA